jgi:hypothetical protein
MRERAGKVGPDSDVLAQARALAADPMLFIDAVTGLSSTREFVGLLADEIEQLREVLVFADGFVVSKTDQYESHTFGLADLYNDTTPLQGVIQRAGCHPRGRFTDAD